MISRIVSSFQHRVSNRRKFYGFSGRGKLKFEIIETKRFAKPSSRLSKSILILDNFRNSLSEARKSGGWQHSLLLPKRFYFWKVGRFRYWRDVDRFFYEVGGHSQNIEQVEIRKYSNITYEAMKASSNSLNMYSFQIHETESSYAKYDYTEAFTLEFSASYAFQHFIDHAIAYINFVAPFLLKNPDMPIILPNPNKSFVDRDFLLKKLGVRNRIINTLPGDKMDIQNLYLIKALPKDILYSVPYELIQNVSEKLCSNEKLANDVILIVREEKNRNYSNIEQITHFLEDYCNSKNLNFKKVYPGRLKTEEFAFEIKNCLILIGIHGGALCNLLSLPPESYIFEFVPNFEGASLLHLTVGSGRKYLPIPINFELATVEVEINLADLMIAMDYALRDYQLNRKMLY
jgi:hypothetical protein